MEKLIRNNILLSATTLVVAAVVFFVDLQTPLGVTDGTLYIALIIPTLWMRHKWIPVAAGLLATALIIAGYLLSPAYTSVVFPELNRLIALLTLWCAVILLIGHKRALLNAQFYKKRWHNFFDRVDQGILIVDADRTIIDGNPALEKLIGCKISALRRRPLSGFLIHNVANDPGPGECIPEFAFSEDRADHEQFCKLKKSNGEWINVSIQVGRLNEGSGLVAVFIVDITESINQRKALMEAKVQLELYARQLEVTKDSLEKRVAQRTQELRQTVEKLTNMSISYRREYENSQNAYGALQKKERLLNTIADNFPNGMLSIIDDERRYVFARGQDTGMPGSGLSGLPGEVYIPLVYRELRASVGAHLSRGFQGEKITFDYLDPVTGHTYQVNGVPIEQSEGRVTRLLLVSQDISSLKQAENKIRAALLKEQELNELKTRFVSTASHEFRTPLGAILSSASLIGMYNGKDDGQKREKHVHRISTSVAHLTSLLDDFLSISKIESGMLPVHCGQLDLNDLIADVMEELEMMRGTAQKIRIRMPRGPLQIFTDKQLLRAIIINLLSNALKYSSHEGIVSLLIRPEEKYIVITVSDDGIGIPEQEQERLFEVFFRASNAEHIRGTGLGLHIVKKYVDMLGGSIRFRSRQGQGATFEVKLEAVAPLAESG